MVELRKAELNDVESIKELAEATWWPVYEPIVGKEQVRYMLDMFYSTAILEQHLNIGSQTFIILTENGIPKGFAAYSPRAEDSKVYKLHKLYCLPADQGKGFGKLLVDAVENAVLDSGCHILDLNVNRENKAKGFYERLGFEVIYQEDIKIGNGFEMNDHVMRKVLIRGL